MEIIIEQKAYEDLRKLVKKLKEVSDEYKEVKDETLLRILALTFSMNKIREEKIKNKILKEIEKEIWKHEKTAESFLNEGNTRAKEWHSGISEGLEIAKDLIKKAFSGVLE